MPRAGNNLVRRGEIRWYTFAAPDKRRPVLLLTRDGVIDVLGEIIVVPVTRTIRGIATEVVLVPEDAPPDLHGTPGKLLHFAGAVVAPPSGLAIRRAGPDGAALPPATMGPDCAVKLDEALGAAVTAAEQVIGIYGRQRADSTMPAVIALELLPADLRPNGM